MSTVRKTEPADTRVEQGPDGPGLWHYYPSRIFYGIPPRVGDRALCGHVKVSPVVFEDGRPSDSGSCVVCVDLERMIP